MTTTPAQRSYPQVLGDMIDVFLSEYGLDSLKVGGPVLSLFEAIAQSQFRNAEDIFTLLQAASLDFATGAALRSIGKSEGVQLQTQTPASGPVTITDTSFAKIASTVYQGLPAPIVGSQSLYVTDASAFPSSGNIYIGRGTTNYEGPIAYSAKTNSGPYWTLTLSTGTQRFHNLNETVIVAQGGNRVVSAGSLVQTLPANLVSAVQFKTLYTATLPDGETSIDGVTVVATKKGTVGNVSAKAIKSFVSPPFTGAAVSNTQPFNNGLPTEDDDTYRERIRAARKTRTKGTVLAIQTSALGTVSQDDNKRVISAALVTGQTRPTTLYIDDGTGYEETSEGVAIESLMDLAFGGEQDFSLSSQPPVTKAQVVTTISAPYILSNGAKLAFAVGGVTSEHTFSSDQFRSVANATAYEIVASINADTTLLWSARTLSSGTKVVVFAKTETNESIQSVAASSNDANAFMGFSSTRVDTIRLYKNDRLLSKDGAVATVPSKAPSAWGTISGAQTLIIAVDGITMNFDGSMFPSFLDADFVSANTGFTAVGNNTPAAWAAVFNARIPGITAAVSNGLVTITSNRGASLAASIKISGGTLLTAMFDPNQANAQGANSDYSLNRNTGKLQLVIALAAGDTLSAGSLSTRAFVQSTALPATTLSATGNLWFSVDGSAQLIPTGVGTSTLLDITQSNPAWGYRVRITSHAGSAIFSGVTTGDWAVLWDTTITSLGLTAGAYRICAVDSASTWFEIAKPTALSSTPSSVTFGQSGLVIVRSDNLLQRVQVPSGSNYTASSISSTLAGLIKGATPSVYKTTSVRIKTNTFSTTGDIALVAADSSGQLLQMPSSGAIDNLTGHMASVESGGGELGTPDFHMGRVVSSSGSSQARIDWSADPLSIETAPALNGSLVGLRSVPDGTTDATARFGTNRGFHTSISTVSAVSSHFDLTLKTAVETYYIAQDRVYVARTPALVPSDSLVVLVDGDASSKRFTVPMGRKLATVGTTYGAANAFIDADNSGQSLAVGFGLTYDFNDCAVYMAARAKTHDQGDATHYTVAPADRTKTILWRYTRLGADGNNAKVKYTLPIAPSAPVAVTVDAFTDGYANIGIRLGSGAARNGYTVRTTTKIATLWVAGGSGAQYDARYVLGLAITGAACFNRASGTTTTITVDVATPGMGTSGHGITAGAQIYVKSNDAGFASGVYTVTGTTSTTITYTDTASSATSGTTSSTAGTMSFDTGGEATLTGASIAPGDFFRIETTSGLPAAFTGQTLRITSVGPQYIAGKLDTLGAVSPAINTAAWNPLNDTTAFKVFQNASQTASAIASAVNGLQAASTLVPVKATVIGDGTGIIDRASTEENNSPTTAFQLADGVNYIRVTSAPGTSAGNYTLTFKSAITASLATNSDWANEVLYIVPRTMKNLADWFNASTISGLFTAAEIVASSAATKLQFASLTPGSDGSLQVQGGSANSVTAPIVGSAQAVASNFLVTQVAAANASGLSSGMYVRIDNGIALPKSCIDANTKLNSVSTSGGIATFTLDNTGTPVWTATNAAQASVACIIEKMGNFIAISDTGLGNATATFASVGEGDWIRITTPASPLLGSSKWVAVVNTGIYRVVRVVSPGLDGKAGTIWIENPNATEQGLAEADLYFYTADSLMPGDQLSISTTLWGAVGTWTVTSVGSSFTNRWIFTVDASSVAPAPVSAPVGALGSQSPLVLAVEQTPGRWYKKLHCISPSQSAPSLVDLKFTTSAGSTKINSSASSTLTALDKLSFPLTIAAGMDGYQHSTGLLGEVNRVLYGDPSDPATYPGVVAAGANINTSGALVRRIQVSLLLRVRSGAPTKDIADQVRSAVAGIINKKGTGQSIPLNQLTTAAGKVGGVVSATMLSPLAQTGSDLITVQPYEKPLVLSPELDILISFVGQ